jgi:GNAT superfamily N-acetyltransferase
MSPATISPGLSAAKLAQIDKVERDAWLDMYAAAPEDAAAELGLEHRLLDGSALLISRSLDVLQFNRLALGTLSSAYDVTLDDAISAFESAGIRNWVVQIPQGTAPLETLCASRGLVPHRRTWAKFVRGPETASARSTLTIRALDQGEARVFGEVAARTYGMPPAAARWLSSLVGRPRWTCFVAFDGSEPVATGAIFIDGTSSWLGIGATLPDHRGQGAQSALLAARIEAASRHGCEALTTETGVPLPDEAGPSYGNIQRLGFRVVYQRTNYCRPQS